MRLINTTNFEQQGNTENDVHLDSIDQTLKAVLNLTETALRSIKIFTPNLERELYNNDSFREVLLNFCRGNRHAQVQLLSADTSHGIQYGHQLIRLAKSITSSMQIRNTPEEYQEEKISFILIDKSSFIFKQDYTMQYAFKSDCKNRAIKLYEIFTTIWEQAEQDPQTKTINF